MLAGFALARLSAALPVFPGAVGFGTDTPAGRGGVIYRVTTLADDGPGSLRWGLARTTGPRVIVFEVSGVIRLRSDLRIPDDGQGEFGHVTVAGQTAPAPGITLAGGGLSIGSHDILIQHLAIRPGDGLKPVNNRDAVKLEPVPGHPVHHVVLDHLSCSWAVDETISTWGTAEMVEDVTISHCIVAEPIVNGGHEKGSHPYGILGGRNTVRLTIRHNLLAFNLGRNPLIRDRTGGAQIINNFIYRPGIWSNGVIYIGDLTLPPHAVTVVGNVVKRQRLPFTLERTGTDGVRGPVHYAASDYRNTIIYVHDVVSEEAGLYLHDNRTFDPQHNEWRTGKGDPWSPDLVRNSSQHPVRHLAADPYAGSGGAEWAALPSTAVEASVLARAGKFPARRDAIDQTLIDKVQRDGGGFLVDLSDRGEDPWAPADVQHRQTLELPDDPGGDADDDGYTNLEEWLHARAATVEADEVEIPRR